MQCVVEIRRRAVDFFVTALLVSVLVSAFIGLTQEYYMNAQEVIDFLT